MKEQSREELQQELDPLKALVTTNKAKGNRADEFIIANKAKENCADELIIANKAKENCADELIIANKEKGNRADELIIANKEKAKRTEEIKTQNEEYKKINLELRTAKGKTKEIENKFKKLFNKVDDAIFLYDSENFNIIEANDATSKIYGYDKDELIGMSCLKFSAEVEKSKLTEQKIKNKGEEIVKIRHHIKKDGSEIIVRLRDYKTVMNKKNMTFAVCHDITDIKKAEQEKFKAIFLAQEKERNRIAADLHDGVGQTITAANMHMNALTELVKDKLDAETYSIFLATKKLVNEATVETRLVSHNIMPPSLKQYGVNYSVKELINHYQKIKPGITFKTTSTIGNKRFDGEIELNIYRCVKEIMNNAIKHANAKTIKVELYHIETQLSIKVTDDSIGFDLKKITSKQNTGIGLTNLAQRVESLGGKFLTETAPNKGTIMIILLKDCIEIKPDSAL